MTVPRELEITLDRTSPVPLYYQLAQSIERAITDGTLTPGDRLENELSLTRRLALSRPTARHAIEELVRKGLVVRKRGVGTQVVGSKFTRDEKLTSLHDDLIAAGRRSSTRLIRYGWVHPEDELGDFQVEIKEDRLLRVERLRLADGRPLALLTNYLPPRLEIPAGDLERTGLYACIRALGVTPKIAHQRIGARLLEPAECDVLEREVPAAALTMTRVAWDDAGRFVEAGRHLYCADEYFIHASLVA